MASLVVVAGGVFFLFFLVQVRSFFYIESVGSASLANSVAHNNPHRFDLVSWNVAAINNNPFEYWISIDNPEYTKLMDDVQNFIENPKDKDLPLSAILDDAKFNELVQLMLDEGFPKDHVDVAATMWKNDYKDRKMIANFMKDKELGLKRLASMPDRITNTINTGDGKVAYRPTVINCYQRQDLDTQDGFWKAWTNFMFKETIKFKERSGGGLSDRTVASLLAPIKKSKYPAITSEEEAVSIPLQTILAAAFDGILVHIMNQLSPSWQPLRETMCENLNLKKNDKTLEILQNSYGTADVIFMQEVASSFIQKAKDSPLGNTFHILSSSTLDTKRDQNSVVMLSRGRFPSTTGMTEVTSQVYAKFDGMGDVPVANGDVFAFTIQDKYGDDLLLASFHGDTNGLATIPVTTAVHQVAQGDLNGKYKLIFGMDANTYSHGTPGKTQDVMEFADDYVKKGLTSCWGNTPDRENYTTFNARTYLQPQLNKAAKREERATKGDVNPKDFILFYSEDFRTTSVEKDNTGKHNYVEGMVFPTLDFPSDHGILHSLIVPKSQSNRDLK